MTDDRTGQPKVPDGWTRCHAYVERKRRFCRQQKNPNSRFCGNHEEGSWVPCPIDPSHRVLERQLEKHLKVCPKLRVEKEQKDKPYFFKNTNSGGDGSVGTGSDASACTLEEARVVAKKVLEIHQRLFSKQEKNILDILEEDIYDSLRLEDYSAVEFKAGLPQAVEQYRIRSGGSRHLQQQASLVGHLRRLEVLSPTPNVKDSSDNIHFLEMGAGRGMLGLVAAGVTAATGSTVKLTMVEKAGTRSKADTVLRKSKEDKYEKRKKPQDNYLKLNNVEWSRIQCDLAHVDVPSLLGDGIRNNSAGDKRFREEDKRVVVIAKHLCGAGTDLAIRSLRNIDADVCVLATCCHGLCCWNDFVGRDFLIDQFGSDFNSFHFELLRKWSAATVAVLDDSGNEAEHQVIQSGDNDSCNVSTVVRDLSLKCGIQGLGRACQRLLDAGRCDYMEKSLFAGSTHHVRICHYVDRDITPQNAVILAMKKRK